MVREQRIITGRQLDGLTAMVTLAVFLYVIKIAAPLGGNAAIQSEPFFKKGKGMLAIALKIDGQERGVYSLPPGATISDLMLACGRTNLPQLDRDRGALKLQTGDEVCLSDVFSPLVMGRMSVAQALALDLPVDINKASAEELMLVPGIGEKTAARIIGLRVAKGRLRSVDELQELSGMGEKKIKKFRNYFFAVP